MIDKKEILKMATHVFKKGQGYPDRRLMHPRREWSVGVLLLTIVILLGGFASSQIYLKYSNIEALIPETEVEIVAYDEAAVKEALETFRKRAGLYGTLNERQVVLEVVSEVRTTTEEMTEINLTTE
tara:strand:- start:971 stop:1348 length:378 start_codon:yes stop_codon:yes gene_type:complete